MWLWVLLMKLTTLNGTFTRSKEAAVSRKERKGATPTNNTLFVTTKRLLQFINLRNACRKFPVQQITIVGTVSAVYSLRTAQL